ncbi:hypothetical protein GB937_000387 [Aspergillus fischeri]|nr:hypothetical protein GB937_000387 [Aspergillus fischeri]
MAICITFGTHEFTSMLEGYENVRAYCYNCQHWNGHCITRWYVMNPESHHEDIANEEYFRPWFTICFIPCIPLSTHKYKIVHPRDSKMWQEVTCHTCRFTQDLRDRPDITPDTRPPQGIPPGPAPPPQAYYAAGAAGGGYPPQGYPPPGQGQGQPQAPPPQNYNYK